MRYNALGNSGVKVSAIAFGSMRWPSEDLCHEIINRGLDRGMNYVDTSTGYVGGKSEAWTGRAVRARRQEIYFSVKPHWASSPSADGVRKAIEGSLQATGLDYFDFYQIWGVQSMEMVEKAVAKGGTVEGVRKAQRDGLVKYGIGFTFHGTPEEFKAAVDTGEFLCATVSYNLLNRKEEDLIAYAAGRGVGVIIMSSLGGGVLGLAGDASLGFLRGPTGGPAYGALRFLLANRNISTALVGFRAVEEVDQALAALDGAESLDEEYRQGLIRRMDAVKLLEGDFCTACGYCGDCPEGVKPAKLMEAMRDFAVYRVPEDRLADWIWSKYPHSDPVALLGKCTECGQCEEKCPQHLKIIEEIRRAKGALGI